MEREPFFVERTYDAPASNVWQAISDVGLIREWYFNVNAFEAEVGFEFTFVSQDCKEGNRHVCKVTEVIPGKKLSYTWRLDGYDGDSLVTFEIFEEGKNKTRLRITHSGLETFPHDLILSKNITGGWTYLLSEPLKNVAEKLKV